ncbi:MAG: hypothetical protein AAF721_11070 [Myxococcota bacterium]
MRATARLGRRTVWLALVGAAAITGVAAGACQVINPDHCANQALPGNEWCFNLSRSTPFCSPCVASFHGCVAFEPVACGDYDASILEGDDDAGSESGGATMGSGGSG